MRFSSFFSRKVKLLFLLSSCLILSGCTGDQTTPTISPGTITINRPANAEQFKRGAIISIQSHVESEDGTKNVILIVDGKAVRTDELKDPLHRGGLLQEWQATAAGEYALQNRMVTLRGAIVESNVVMITVVDESPTAGPTASATPTATVSPTGNASATATATAAAALSASPVPATATTTQNAPVATVTSNVPMLTVNEDANCRNGPGTVYPVITGLRTGQTATVTGRNAEGTWWVVNHPAGFGTCWILGSLVTTSGATAQLPIVAAPPTPLPPTSTVTAVPTRTFTATQTLTSLPSATPTHTPTVTPLPPTATPFGPTRTATTPPTSTVTTAPVTLSAPQPISPSGSLSCRGSVDLSWNSVNGAVYYEWKVIAIGGSADEGSSSGTSFGVSGLVCGQSYSWQVRAVNAQGQSGDYSTSLKFTIQN